MTAIGIDLGTTNSCVAVYRNGHVVVIKGAEGLNVTPSVVAARDNGEVLVGMPAKREMMVNPEFSFRAIKRLIGRRFADPQVSDTQKMSAFQIAPAENGEAWVVGRARLQPPAEISGLILKRLKEAAERHLGKPVKKAVITVPAFFNDSQRQATKDAAAIAGLEVLRIINEPVAAALAVDLEDHAAEQRRVAVYDLGGGTFDLSILTMTDGAYEVAVTNGDTFLGGEDFDALIMARWADQFQARYNHDLRTNKIAVQRLRDAAEEIKRMLSESEVAQLDLEFIDRVRGEDGETKPVEHFLVTLTRGELETMTAPLIERTIAICEAALAEAGLEPKDIDQVLLVGGMTRMPAVRAAVQELFEARPIAQPNPDEVVAIGAAVMAAALTGELDIDLADVIPLAIAIETADHALFEVMAAQQRIPHRKIIPVTTAEHDQSAITVRVRQGNELNAADNLPLGEFHLDRLRPAPAGAALIDLTVDVDADGMVLVQARDRATGRSNALTMEATGLAPKAVERMAKAARAAAGGAL